MAGLGAVYGGKKGTAFRVWAPRAERVELEIVGPGPRTIPLTRRPRGYFVGHVDGVEPGTLYAYRLDGGEPRPDPASRSQPRGVHGPSSVVDPGFPWSDDRWRGLDLAGLVLYELHVGTFTPEGTFDAIVPRLDALVELGVTAIELMPVAQFPGRWNWGYDGVGLWAVQSSYGGPDGLRRLVDAAHARGLGVVLDVVYNHLGPEGNYLREFGPYFTDAFRTPWGEAVNYDGAGSDEVRRFFIENALMWVREHHVDGLRLDAVHAILDRSAFPFLEELGAAVHTEGDRQQRRVLVIPESDDNDPRLVERTRERGLGLDAVWCDDFHHALHASLTGERQGYYQDFGDLEFLEWAWSEGFVYAGQRSRYRGRRHGRSSRNVPPERFVVFLQNHDQVGNRAGSERIASLVDFEALKLGAAAVLLSPFVPLLFMGEEYGEEAPFPYFVDHSDSELVEAVRRGRQAEFAAFAWEAEIPDPASEATVARARIAWDWSGGSAAALRAWYRECLRVRREMPLTERDAAADEEERVVVAGRGRTALVLHFCDEPTERRIPLASGDWDRVLDSAAAEWGGPGSAVPERVESRGGAAQLALGAWSAVLLARA